jgi:hypothetical protein
MPVLKNKYLFNINVPFRVSSKVRVTFAILLILTLPIIATSRIAPTAARSYRLAAKQALANCYRLRFIAPAGVDIGLVRYFA